MSSVAWAGTLKSTHYWDCNGQGCDATVLQPWDASSYWSPSQYAPQDPEDHGGPSEYGEKMWFTGAASDALADLLGDDDGCCGSDADSTGCGKCVLLRNPGAVQADWRAIAMKKNRCPPWSAGCDRVHFDLAVPGFDHFAYSTANVCGPQTSGWAEQPTDRDESHASYTLGDWYVRHANTALAEAECDALPAEYQARPPAPTPTHSHRRAGSAPSAQSGLGPADTCRVAGAQGGCRLFARWGWTTGDPDLEYAVVPCPPAFTAHVQAAFGPDGPAGSRRCPTDNNCGCDWATADICSGAGDGSVCFAECCCPFAPAPPSSTSDLPPPPPAPPLPPAPPGGYLPPPPSLPPVAPASSLPVATMIAAGGIGGGLTFL